MAETVRLRCPARLSAISVGGVAYTADATGCIVVPAADVPECQRHGFVPAPEAPPAPKPPPAAPSPAPAESAPKPAAKKTTEKAPEKAEKAEKAAG